jgi:hypothetical protein
LFANLEEARHPKGRGLGRDAELQGGRQAPGGPHGDRRRQAARTSPSPPAHTSAWEWGLPTWRWRSRWKPFCGGPLPSAPRPREPTPPALGNADVPRLRGVTAPHGVTA